MTACPRRHRRTYLVALLALVPLGALAALIVWPQLRALEWTPAESGGGPRPVVDVGPPTLAPKRVSFRLPEPAVAPRVNAYVWTGPVSRSFDIADAAAGPFRLQDIEQDGDRLIGFSQGLAQALSEKGGPYLVGLTVTDEHDRTSDVSNVLEVGAR